MFVYVIDINEPKQTDLINEIEKKCVSGFVFFDSRGYLFIKGTK